MQAKRLKLRERKMEKSAYRTALHANDLRDDRDDVLYRIQAYQENIDDCTADISK